MPKIVSYRKEYDKIHGANKVTVVDDKGKDAGATYCTADDEGDVAAQAFFDAQCKAHNGAAPTPAPPADEDAPAPRRR